MGNYQSYASRLMGYVPKLSFPLAQDLVNQAWALIRERRAWTFLLKEGAINLPASISAGTLSITQGSASVTAAGASKTAFDAITFTDPITARQLRLRNSLYNISSYDSTSGIATLDRVVRETTSATSSYQLYRCYITPPESNFLRFVSVYDTFQGYRLRINYTKAEIDRRDPLRGASGLAYYVASYKSDSSGEPLYELWPHPTTGQYLTCTYQQRGSDFVLATESLPSSIPDEALHQKALALAAQWAQMNAGRFKELQGSDWRFAQSAANAAFEARIKDAERQDDERMLQNFLQTDDAFAPIMDGAYLQSHPL